MRTSRLAPAVLREAATQLGVPRHRIDTVIRHVRHDRAAAARDAGYQEMPMLMKDSFRQDREAEHAFTNEVLATLEDPTLEDRTAQLVVRLAIRAHLAPLGDLLLRLSEWPQAVLTWYCPPDSYHREDDDAPATPVALGWHQVHGAPQPLHARILRLPPSEQGTDDEPFFTAEDRTPPPAPPSDSFRYTWTVGWQVDGAFTRYGGSAEPTLAAARFGAATLIAEMLRHPETLRLPISGRLLIPRQSSDLLDDQARVIDLELMLIAMMNAHRCERDYGTAPSAEEWAMRPHVTAAGELGSVAGLLLDHLSLPLPERDHPANHALPGQKAFDAFLRSQAVVVTPLATTYLSGLGDAGPGERPLAERHTAAMRIVLAADPALLERELPAPPAGTTHRELMSIALLELWLTPAPDGDDDPFPDI